MSSDNKNSKNQKQQTEEEVILQALLEKLNSALEKSAQSNEPAAQEIVKELQEIKSALESKKLEISKLESGKEGGKKKRSPDFMSIGKLILSAARWLRLFYELFGGD